MEKEVFGVIYERFSVGRKLDRIARKYHIKTVLEMPAHGAKAMPSIYSLGFADKAKKIYILLSGIMNLILSGTLHFFLPAAIRMRF